MAAAIPIILGSAIGGLGAAGTALAAGGTALGIGTTLGAAAGGLSGALPLFRGEPELPPPLSPSRPTALQILGSGPQLAQSSFTPSSNILAQRFRPVEGFAQGVYGGEPPTGLGIILRNRFEQKGRLA